ncbi:hypothetical protein [Methanobacterium congolense]|nr:hypothetical protein [Methanobacterium congolense]
MNLKTHENLEVELGDPANDCYRSFNGCCNCLILSSMGQNRI